MADFDRFFRRGISEMHFLPDVAGTSPTRGEISAGVDLSEDVSAITGFQLENSPIATPSLKTRFDEQIDGPDTTADSRLTFYDRGSSAAIRTALARGTDGFVVMMPYGDLEDDRCEVWPVRATGVNDVWDLGAQAATFVVGFAITVEPEQNAVIPAA